MNEDSEKKGCEPANSELYKASDAKGLGADAKIIITLLKQQPLRRIQLCEKANINESTFSRYKRLLLNKGILKESAQGFSLWYFRESSTLWDIMLSGLQEAAGHLLKLKLEKLRLVKNQATGKCEKIYDSMPIEGVIILRGAAKLEDALHSLIPRRNIDFLMFGILDDLLVTPVSVQENDRIVWQNKKYEVTAVKQFFDGETLSYSLAKFMSSKPK
jgi:hypothetical protein